MYTYQMVGLADQNGKTYECKYGTYSKDKGFEFDEEVFSKKCKILAFINLLFHEDLWKLKQEPKKMSLQDIEKELGYRVQIVDPEIGTGKKVSPERKKEVDDTIDVFKRLFGLDHIDPADYY